MHHDVVNILYGYGTYPSYTLLKTFFSHSDGCGQKSSLWPYGRGASQDAAPALSLAMECLTVMKAGGTSGVTAFVNELGLLRSQHQ